MNKRRPSEVNKSIPAGYRPHDPAPPPPPKKPKKAAPKPRPSARPGVRTPVSTGRRMPDKKVLAGAVAAVVCVVVALVLVLGGDDKLPPLPDGAAARVGDHVITRATADHWIAATAAASGGQLPDAPTFSNCIAEGRRKARAAKGQPKVTDTQLREQCQQAYDSIRSQAMSFLVSARWLEEVADERGITLSEADLDTAFAAQIRKRFKTKKALDGYLATSRLTEDDLRATIRVSVLTERIQKDVANDLDPITAADIRAYYEQNVDTVSKPERRRIELVLARTDAAAEKALAQLRSGKDIAAVADRFSIDPTTDNGVLTAERSELDTALGDAVFEAQTGELTGPVETPYGTAVFRVTEVIAGDRQTVEQATPAITAALRRQRSEQALEKLTDKWADELRAKTLCAPDLAFAVCSNGPEESPAGGPANPLGAVGSTQPSAPTAP